MDKKMVGEVENQRLKSDPLIIEVLRGAILLGNLVKVQTCLSEGANPNLPNEQGLTPLHLAVWLGGALSPSPDCRDRRHDLAHALLIAGADPNSVDSNGRTPLHFAATDDTPEAASILLSHGADMHYRVFNSPTPLDEATRFGRPSVIAAFEAHRLNTVLPSIDLGREDRSLDGTSPPSPLARL